MTNKEAIGHLLTIMIYSETDGYTDKAREALEMAIKALEQPDIIRCAECKWLQCNMRPDGTLPKGVDEFECRHWCGGCDPTDFCSYAERDNANFCPNRGQRWRKNYDN